MSASSPPCGLRNLEGRPVGLKNVEFDAQRDATSIFLVCICVCVCSAHICLTMAARVSRFSSPTVEETDVVRSGFYYLSRGSIHVVFFELWSMK